MRTILSVASIIAIAVIVLVPFGFQTKWHGRFELTIVINADQPIDKPSLLFATCWRETDAKSATKNLSDNDLGFRTARKLTTNQCAIDVPCSGTENAYGLGTTYHQPKFLVAEYRLTDNPENAIRKLFIIPDGKGPRTMTICLP